MDWVEGIGQVMLAVRLDEDMLILSMSPMAEAVFGIKEADVQGKSLSEISRRDAIIAHLPPSWRRDQRLQKDSMGGLLEDAARAYGNATSWVWLLTPSGRMFRGICNVIKLDVGYVVYTANIEDPFNRTILRGEQDGTLVGLAGSRLDLHTLPIFEDFIGGSTLQQIATDHAISTSKVRTILDNLAEATGHNTAGELRISVCRLSTEELIPARQNIFPILCEQRHGFPQDDLPTD
ncbi:hypothetical protein CWI75_17935 [Kineobactrum sediminis]|uniref:PAS domain-containing protein n=1 Tax=Kineobactrum sediminis TaxID=1905677 RepID=A0A2N5XXU2_9GAMM|nr:PAS domain-containing protein [Kineobactrum sediminis]PLW80975.1 hypothetical protein CWI75_17935 [Kineobactrum sediminis]